MFLFKISWIHDMQGMHGIGIVVWKYLGRTSERGGGAVREIYEYMIWMIDTL